MHKLIFSRFGLLVLAVVTLVVIGLANTAVKTVRMDLTENKLFTITDGSKNIIAGLERSVEMKLFFSDKLTQEKADLREFRNYALRVKELLAEYALLSDGKITLTVIDPEPFSEAEDEAAEYGVQSVPVSFGGDEFYFGMVVIADGGAQETIPFFQPDREEFLEYEISELLAKLGKQKIPMVGVLTSLQLRGGFDMATRQPTPAWSIMQQIEGTFDVQSIPVTTTEIPSDVDILFVAHPKDLSEETLYAIDQYVLGGGKAVIFVDPHAEQDQPMGGMMADPTVAQNSQLDLLFEQWGIELLENKVLGDAGKSMMVSLGRGYQPIRHLGLQSFDIENFPEEDLVTSQLETINVASAGILKKRDGSEITFEPVIQSSELAMPLDAEQFKMLRDPTILAEGFKATKERYTVAARISGKAKTAFPDGAPEVTADEDTSTEGETEADVTKEPKPHLSESSENIHLLVVADTDILSDRLWVQVQDFFGQRVAQAWADNGDFVMNSLEYMSGSSDLISIRSRGKFSRPFTVVQDLQRDAESRFQEKEKELNQRLMETEQKLAELQQQKEGENILQMSPEQEQALVNFQDEKLKIRKQLRDVRHQLDKDIRDLGTQLKLINILSVPLLLTVIAIIFAWGRGRRKME